MKVLGDILLTRKVTTKQAEKAISEVFGLSDFTVLRKVEDCLELNKETNWVVLYEHDTAERIPCHISPDGATLDSERRFDLARHFDFEIGWSADSDPNPFKWHFVYPNGIEKIEILSESDLGEDE